MKKNNLDKLVSKGLVAAMAVSIISGVATTANAAEQPKPETTGDDNNAIKADVKKDTKKQTEKRNVMYYGDWSVWGGQDNFMPQDIPADQLTHLNFSFLDFDSNGDLVFTDKDAAASHALGQPGVTWGGINAGILPALEQLRAKNPNLKLGISVGGWSKSGDFATVAADPVKRANLVNQLMKFIEYTNMDFVDIDWEFPGFERQPDFVDNIRDEGTPHGSEADKELFAVLLEDLRAALDAKEVEHQKEYELSIAIHPSIGKIEKGIDIDRVFDAVDFCNIMSYDMRGAWDDNAGHQTGLYTNPHDPLAGQGLSIDESVDYLVDNGAEKSKIVIGAAYYTRGWEQVSAGPDANNPGLFGEAGLVTMDADQTPSRGARNEADLNNGDGGRMSGIWSYRNIDRLKTRYTGLKEYWDDVAKAPYLYDENSGSFFTYDNVRSIGEKTKYVHDNELGGMIAWMASQDKDTASGKRNELSSATKQGLFGEAALPEHEIVYTDLDVDVKITKKAVAWGSPTYIVTVTNKERLEESNDVLKTLEEKAETIKLPKLYFKTEGLNITGADYRGGNSVEHKDGYAVVDLSKVYDARTLEPGRKYEFELTANEDVDISAFKSVHLTQRISMDGPEMNQQTIYGESVEGEAQNTAPRINGTGNKTINVGDSFDAMAGVTAADKEDGNLTSSVTVSGRVDTTTAGTYTLTYTVRDSKGLETVVTRTITVEAVETPEVTNNAPVISGAEALTLKVGEKFLPKKGITASDIEDGNLTASIKVSGAGKVDTTKPGTYKVTYTVVDSQGLQTKVVRNVVVIEADAVQNTAPVIKGANNVTITQGEKFQVKKGVTATDKEDGNLTKSLVVEGRVNINKPGDYTLTYKVTDSQGLETVVTRVVTVAAIETETPEVENTAPVLSGLTTTTIKVGESFNAMTGVSANDAEDGNLTSNVVVSGTVNTAKAGAYTLTYTVTDSQGLETSATRVVKVVEAQVSVDSPFGVGQGIEWPSQVNAPFADMGAWNNGEFSNSGALNLKKINQDTGVKFFNLGFLQASGGVSNGKVNWGWGGHEVLSEKHADNAQYQGIKKSMKDIRELGGDVTVSIGGLTGTAPWEVSGDTEVLYNTYKEIVEGYGLTRLDLDIEGAAAMSHNMDANAAAIKKVQDETGVDIAITLAVLPSGLTPVQLNVVRDFLEAGVDIELVNLMTMCYGPATLLPGENYGTASVRAVDSTKDQLKEYFAKYGNITLTDAQAYRKIGTTPSVGFEGAAHPNFPKEWTQIVTDHAIEKGIGMTSMWCINRDAMAQPNQGIFAPYEHTNIMKAFGSDESPEVPNPEPEVPGPEVPGPTPTPNPEPEVPNPEPTPGPGTGENEDGIEQFDISKVYVEGDVVMYKGAKYTVKWWTQGSYPDESAAFEKELISNNDGSVDYMPGMVCTTGMKVKYEGKVYEAKWWTTSTPGSDASWALL